jgi:hypothetical protein
MSHGVVSYRNRDENQILYVDTHGDIVLRLSKSTNGHAVRVAIVDKATNLSKGSIRVKGEDLTALCAFLREIPNEAFPAPAPSYDKPEWADGDKVFHSEDTGHAWVYTRKGGAWKPFGVGHGKTDGRVSSDGASTVMDAWITERVERDSSFFRVLVRLGEPQ